MTTLAEPDLPRATDGEIAAINLESARRRAWARFAQDPRLPGAAEAIVYNENLAGQFLGDLDARSRPRSMKVSRMSCYPLRGRYAELADIVPTS